MSSSSSRDSVTLANAAGSADHGAELRTDRGDDRSARLRLRWRISFLVITTVGICLSADLMRLHVKVHTDPAYHSYCAISEWANCETVAASDYAVFLRLPVALWGLLGCLVMAALAVWGLYMPRTPASWPFGILFWMSLFSSATGSYLFFVSHFIIESVCVVCIGTYLVNLSLLVVSLVEIRRLRSGPFSALKAEMGSFRQRRLPLTLLGATVMLGVLVLWMAVPPYWRLSATEGPGGLPVGATLDGHPWIGAKRPVLTIEEFSDYQCPYCLKGHDKMRKLVQQHPDRVRLVHRNHPLDQACNEQIKRPFHPHACRYAAMAVCAQTLGRFWEANDLLFSRGRERTPVTVEELAQASGIKVDRLAECLKGEQTHRRIDQDLEAGRALKIRGTPTYVIGEHSYPGAVPAEVLKEALGE